MKLVMPPELPAYPHLGNQRMGAVGFGAISTGISRWARDFEMCAYLNNIGRGAMVDLTALAAALQPGQVRRRVASDGRTSPGRCLGKPGKASGSE